MVPRDSLTCLDSKALTYQLYSALSEHGRSYSYDEKASGFGRGEGAACLFIKRLDDALRDGDPVHALIRSTACNHSGRTEGITMPNGLAQQDLLWAVHNAAGLDPSDTPVVEVCVLNISLLMCVQNS